MTGAHGRPGGGGGLLDSTAKKVAVFGSIGLVVLVGGGIAAMQLAGGGAKEMVALAYQRLTKSYQAGDYDTAKSLYTQALGLDATNPQYAKSLKLFFFVIRRTPRSTLFPYTTLFR